MTENVTRALRGLGRWRVARRHAGFGNYGVWLDGVQVAGMPSLRAIGRFISNYRMAD